MTLKEAEVLALSTLKQVMEEKVRLEIHILVCMQADRLSPTKQRSGAWGMATSYEAPCSRHALACTRLAIVRGMRLCGSAGCYQGCMWRDVAQ
jgi:hypothetical protein